MNSSHLPHPAAGISAGLYVHIPFCLSRCGYCAFVSGLYDAALADAYLSALERELSARAPTFRHTALTTLFIGGGTPTGLSTAQLRRLLAFLPLPLDGEATCEANPDSADTEKLLMLRECGINRMSFGVQTFSSVGLALLERRHDRETACRAVTEAVRLGFASVSLDLIVGWPGQSVDMMREDLRRAIDLGVRHISCYQLILEETSGGYARLSALLDGVDDEHERRLWDACEEFLESRGFVHYETSNYALPGYQCRHNLDTWRGMDYLGIGLGAHSHVAGSRFANTVDLQRYLEKSADPEAITVFSENLDPVAKARECAVFWLRVFEGIDLAAFARKTGFDFFALYEKESPPLLSRGVLECAENGQGIRYVRVAKRFQPVLDAVLVELV